MAYANAINDFGWIAGMNSDYNAYVLIPHKGCKEVSRRRLKPAD